MCCKNFEKNLILFSLTFLIGISFSILFGSNFDFNNEREDFSVLPQFENSLSEQQLPKTIIQPGPSVSTDCKNMEAIVTPLIWKMIEIESWLKSNQDKSTKEKKRKREQLAKLNEAVDRIKRERKTISEIVIPPKNGISDLLYRQRCY